MITPSVQVESLKRHEKFWFDDGSIILVARENTGFRVYCAFLAAQLTIFADMLTSSSPSTEEMTEGCPVVHLSDTLQDVAHLLNVLLPKSRKLEPCVEVLMGWAEIGRKRLWNRLPKIFGIEVPGWSVEPNSGEEDNEEDDQ